MQFTADVAREQMDSSLEAPSGMDETFEVERTGS